MASETAQRLYDALVPFNRVDETGHLLAFCEAFCGGERERIHEIVSDSDESEGWGIVFDPDRCPEFALPYLAQFVGVTLEASLTTEQKREKIRMPEGFARGTLAALLAAVKRTLTGTQIVMLDERFGGSAYALRIRTLATETPSETLTEKAIRSQKPAGLVLEFEALTGQDWADVDANYTDWADVATEDDWLDLATTLP